MITYGHKYQEVEGLPGVLNLAYLLSVDKNVDPEEYEPVSYEHWKMLKELEPTKFRGKYDAYIQSKNEQFLQEVENRKNQSFVLNYLTLSLLDRSIDESKEALSKITTNPLFHSFVGDYKKVIDFLDAN